MVSLEELRKLMPYSTGRVDLFAGPLNEAMQEFGITTARREAAFLAQVAHESGELRYVLEIDDGRHFAQYEGRSDLGNTHPGDGARFPGRGLLQATGRGVYTRLAAALSMDCVEFPSVLEGLVGASRSAAWIWSIDKSLNGLADLDRFETITKLINGGFNGLAARTNYWCRARALFGID